MGNKSSHSKGGSKTLTYKQREMKSKVKSIVTIDSAAEFERTLVSLYEINDSIIEEGCT